MCVWLWWVGGGGQVMTCVDATCVGLDASDGRLFFTLRSPWQGAVFTGLAWDNDTDELLLADDKGWVRGTTSSCCCCCCSLSTRALAGCMAMCALVVVAVLWVIDVHWALSVWWLGRALSVRHESPPQAPAGVGCAHGQPQDRRHGQWVSETRPSLPQPTHQGYRAPCLLPAAGGVQGWRPSSPRAAARQRHRTVRPDPHPP